MLSSLNHQAIGDPLSVARWMLFLAGTRLSVHYRDRKPAHQRILLVSNHRSFLDVPVLMAALNQPVHFACHHYLGQVPVLANIVRSLGCFPLSTAARRGHSFLHQATGYLRDNQTVGVFPEGAQPMVEPPARCRVVGFNRGFAHLALRMPVTGLVVLPVAIASFQESCESVIPLRALRLFDPSEPLFDQPGWHPAIFYERVSVIVGQPIAITPQQRAHYRGRTAGPLAAELADRCQTQIETLLRQGCY